MSKKRFFYEKFPIFSVTKVKIVLKYATKTYNYASGSSKQELKGIRLI